MRFQVIIALGAFGCSGGDPSPGPIEPTIPDPTEDSTSTIDTAPEGSSIDARYFAISARFAYDPSTHLHLSFAESGAGLTPIQLIVTLIDSSVAYSGVVNADNSCTVTLEIDGNLPVAPWVEPNGAWTGFDVPAGATVRDNCQFYGLPSEFAEDAGGHVSKWRYGVGIAALDPEVEAQLRGTLAPSEWDALEPYAVGGALSSNLLEPATGTGDGYAPGLGLGFEIDGNFEIVVDGVGNPEPIPRDLVEQDVGVARGYYEATFGPFEPGSFLTGEPL